MRIVPVRPLLGALLLCGLLLPAPATATTGAGLTPAEEQGRQLYLTGSGVAGRPVTARFGPERIELPGEVATCGSCHGYDGRGRTESGIAASDITWSALSKRYGHVHPGGRVHPPLTPEDLRALITAGRYPDGTPVDPAMPIFNLSSGDLDNLVAYLQRLGTLLDPGVGERSLRVGYLQSAAQDPATGQALEAALRAYFARLNADGGIYERRIELITAVPPDAPDQLESWLLKQDLFALVAPYAPGLEKRLAEASQRTETPLLGPYTLFPPRGFETSRYTFYLFPGLAEQLYLVYTGATQTASAAPLKTAILFGSDPRLEQAAEELQQRLEEAAVTPVRLPLSADPQRREALIETLRKQQVELVLLLGDAGEGRPFLQAAARAGWSPRVGLSGPLAGELLLGTPVPLRDRFYLALPTIASDRHPAPELAALLRELTNDPSRIPAQVAALATAELFTEALRRSGRRLDRRGLIAALEKTYRFETGLIPPLSFSANRRIGSDGIYLVTLQAVREDIAGPENFHIEWVTPPTRR